MKPEGLTTALWLTCHSPLSAGKKGPFLQPRPKSNTKWLIRSVANLTSQHLNYSPSGPHGSHLPLHLSSFSPWAGRKGKQSSASPTNSWQGAKLQQRKPVSAKGKQQRQRVGGWRTARARDTAGVVPLPVIPAVQRLSQELRIRVRGQGLGRQLSSWKCLLLLAKDLS